jgi:hypothetical protein
MEAGAAAARGRNAITGDTELWKIAVMEKLRRVMQCAGEASLPSKLTL